jgi:hypothetical protein
MKGTKCDSALKFTPQVRAELLGAGTNFLIWASKGFRHGFERIKPRRCATALWGKLKINDTNVVTFHPALMAVLSERAAA